MGNLLLVHGGGPTAVINASLYGAIKQAKKEHKVNRILVAIGGTSGVLKEHFKDITHIDEEKLELLLQTPGSAIGTSRDVIEDEDYSTMVDIFKKHNIIYVLLNGGNGTMDTCGKIAKACQNQGIFVVGIPKTMDNDIACTDHSPGYPSAARFIAQTVAEVCIDVQSLPIHVVVIETCGRNAGWITAASSLASEMGVDGPDLIYLPEVPFDEEKYIDDVKKCLETKKGIVVVCSEGLKNKDGLPIVKPVFQSSRATYFGDVSSHLAMLVIQKLGYKARSEKPGLVGRASMPYVSNIDRKEAVLVGTEAVKACVQGHTGKMVALVRDTSASYHVHTELVDIKQCMLIEKTLPLHYINESQNGVTESFKQWCKPLLGEHLPKFINLQSS